MSRPSVTTHSPLPLPAVGDLTAGNLNDGGGAPLCANSAYNDDITLSAGAVLCQAFGADCMFTAWGGITLPSMTQL